MLTPFSLVDSFHQTITFFLSLLLGGLICCGYDLLRGRRVGRRPHPLALFFEDVLFCVVAAFLVFCFLLVRCQGQLRLFALMGMGAGWVLTRRFASPYLLRLFVFFFRLLRGLMAKIRRVEQKIGRKISQVLEKIWQKGKNILKRKQKPLENHKSVDV